MTTSSTENYLKAIREIRNANRRVTTCALARHLNIAPASVTNMVKRLAVDGLLDYVPYRGVALTKMGERLAYAVSQRHEIIERYLTNAIGFDAAQAHAEAERWEHIVSDELARRLHVRTRTRTRTRTR